MIDGLWTVPPSGQAVAAHSAWTTLRAAHTAHSPDDEVGLVSAIKRVWFQLSKCSTQSKSGSRFDHQMGLIWVDKYRRV